ncbi:DUF998 domain-containing protein [Streptomyces sp. NPDC051018]|uniref:DUF998 domain-containing protein n=1 Tax=Streptomyces sp. NPDC051018 TaxID=3365639 RepID=UPI00378FFB98
MHLPLRTRQLLIGGAVAGPLFVTAFAVQGALREHYDWRRHPVSSLALGDLGAVQTAGFLVTGTLGLGLAAGLHRVLSRRGAPGWGPRLVAAWAVGLLGAGAFVTDPVSGYPPGTPERPAAYSGTEAALHDAFSLLAFAALTAACSVFALRFAREGERARAAGSAVAGAVVATAFVLSAMGFDHRAGLAGTAGLFQRLSITVGWCWLSLLALDLLRRDPYVREDGGSR